MKSSQRLKEKLHGILPDKVDLAGCNWPWTDSELEGIAKDVQRYLNQSGDVINEDPLIDWLEEYKFFLSEKLRQEDRR